MGDWLETYRGTVFRWEVDHNDHFTVAYYFARIADAGQNGFRVLACRLRFHAGAQRGDACIVETRAEIARAPEASADRAPDAAQ